jgi:opacity protein-like surface antigen
MTFRARALLAATALTAMAGQAVAADIVYQPPIVEAPPVYEAPVEVVSTGGWYIRGDIDYHAPRWRGGDYVTYGAGPVYGNSFATGSLRPAFSVGGGVGYQANKHFRADFTADYWFRSTFNGTTVGACGTCTDTATMSALLLMANAYVHIGKWGRWSPYVGAGIGGARVHWSDLQNTLPNGNTVTHPGATSWRFAVAAMAGTTVCLTDKIDLDLGYRYTRISGGPMFAYDQVNTVGPGVDRGFDVHEGRAGLRYKFGGGHGGGLGSSSGCGYKPAPHYEPPVIEPPIYK